MPTRYPLARVAAMLTRRAFWLWACLSPCCAAVTYSWTIYVGCWRLDDELDVPRGQRYHQRQWLGEYDI